MRNDEPRKYTILHITMVFIRRLIGYGILFVLCFASIPYLFSYKLQPLKSEKVAQYYDSFSLKTPDPEAYWSTRTDDYQTSYPLHSNRIDTLLVQWIKEGEEWVCVGLKDHKTVDYYIHSYEMRRIIVNDCSVFLPMKDACEALASGIRVDSTSPMSLKRLAEKIGPQVIHDLLTMGLVYFNKRSNVDHRANELMFNGLRMAFYWNRLHPEAKVDVSDIPTTITRCVDRGRNLDLQL